MGIIEKIFRKKRPQSEFQSEKLTDEEYVREVARRLHGSEAPYSPSSETAVDEERAYDVERAHATERERSLKEFRVLGRESRETLKKNIDSFANVLGHIVEGELRREAYSLRIFWPGDPPTWAELRFLIVLKGLDVDNDSNDIAAYEKVWNGDYKIIRDKQRDGFWIIFQR